MRCDAMRWEARKCGHCGGSSQLDSAHPNHSGGSACDKSWRGKQRSMSQGASKSSDPGAADLTRAPRPSTASAQPINQEVLDTAQRTRGTLAIHGVGQRTGNAQWPRLDFGLMPWHCPRRTVTPPTEFDEGRCVPPSPGRRRSLAFSPGLRYQALEALAGAADAAASSPAVAVLQPRCVIPNLPGARPRT